MRLVLVAALVVGALAGCSDDEEKAAAPVASAPAPAASSGAAVEMPPASLDPPKPARTEAGGRTDAGTPFPVTANGYGSYEIGQTQDELVEAELAGDFARGAGCVIGTGSALLHSPELRFAGGKLVQVQVSQAGATTDAGLPIGATFAAAQAAYPLGRPVAGAGGGTGLMITDGANTLLLKVSGNKVTSFVAGVTSSVEKTFASGSGC